jgi:SAM-dependent methyltransferase
MLLEGLGPAFPAARVVLDIAPSKQTGLLLGRTRPGIYLRMDLDPAADGRQVDVQGSMTAMPLDDGCVDLAVCYHVLEHIPDDHRALSELRRVLAPGGTALVQVPWRPDRPTDEDPAATAEERVRRFGQHDHVRYYGHDFDGRLVAAGLNFTRVTPRQVVGIRVCWFFGLTPDESVWIVRRDDANHHDVPAESVRLPTLTFLYDLLDGAEARAAKAEERADRAEDQGQRSRTALERVWSRWSVRAKAAARRVVRRRQGSKAGALSQPGRERSGA